MTVLDSQITQFCFNFTLTVIKVVYINRILHEFMVKLVPLTLFRVKKVSCAMNL